MTEARTASEVFSSQCVQLHVSRCFPRWGVTQAARELKTKALTVVVFGASGDPSLSDGRWAHPGRGRGVPLPEGGMSGPEAESERIRKAQPAPQPDRAGVLVRRLPGDAAQGTEERSTGHRDGRWRRRIDRRGGAEGPSPTLRVRPAVFLLPRDRLLYRLL